MHKLSGSGGVNNKCLMMAHLNCSRANLGTDNQNLRTQALMTKNQLLPTHSFDCQQWVGVTQTPFCATKVSETQAVNPSDTKARVGGRGFGFGSSAPAADQDKPLVRLWRLSGTSAPLRQKANGQQSQSYRAGNVCVVTKLVPCKQIPNPLLHASETRHRA